MKGEKKPVLLGIGIGRPKPDEEGEDYVIGDDGEEAEDETRELKMTAMRAFLSGVKGNDPEAMVEALDAYMEC